MLRVRTLVVSAVAVLSASVAFAQKPANPGNPGNPGGGPPPPPPAVVLDALDRPVGEVIEVNGQASALVKYALPDGDYVVASVNRQVFTTGPNNLLQSPRVYFTTADCSGDAYFLNSSFGSPTNSAGFFLSRRQGLILDNIFFGPPEPITPDPSCPIAFPAGRWLYASEITACPLFFQFGVPGGSSITFQATYGFGGVGSNGFCFPNTTTFPSNVHPGAVFEVYQRIEDISTRFRTPFYIP